MNINSLYNIGIGRNKSKTVNKKIHNNLNDTFDGYKDGIAISSAESRENLTFMKAIEEVNKKNDSDKIKMLNKINLFYGKKSYSIESFCRETIMKIESKGTKNV